MWSENLSLNLLPINKPTFKTPIPQKKKKKEGKKIK